MAVIDIGYEGKNMKHIESVIEFKDQDFHYVAAASIVKDNNYGADADGNRGISVTFLDEFVIRSVFDGHGNDVTDKMVALDDFLDVVEEDVMDLLGS